MVACKAGPALQGIVVPRPARQVLIHVEIAVREYVESGAFLVAEQRGHGVLKLLAEANVQHASVQRPPPHTHVEPTRARERSGGGAGQNQIGGGGEHGFPRIRIVIQFAPSPHRSVAFQAAMPPFLGAFFRVAHPLPPRSSSVALNSALISALLSSSILLFFTSFMPPSTTALQWRAAQRIWPQSRRVRDR